MPEQRPNPTLCGMNCEMKQECKTRDPFSPNRENLAKAVHCAIDMLFERSRKPKPKPGMEKADAIRITLRAASNGFALAHSRNRENQYTQVMLQRYESANSKAQKVRIAIDTLLRVLTPHSDFPPGLVTESGLRIITFSQIMGMPLEIVQRKMKGIEIGIERMKQTRTFAAKIETRASQMRRRIGPTRVNVGRQPEALLAQHLAMAWLEITGSMPPKNNVKPEPRLQPFSRYSCPISVTFRELSDEPLRP
jgi:hypothetical protein